MKQLIKLCFGGVVIMIFLFFLIIHDQVDEGKYRTHDQLAFDNLPDRHYVLANKMNSSVVSVDDVIKKYKPILEQEMEDYDFPPKMSLRNFTMVTGGQPLRNIIVATWRSGSTFLGDLINSVPGNYYHYEPLLDFGISQIRGPPYSQQAVSNLRNLLNCDYSNLGNYLDYGYTHTYLFSHNRRLWRECDIYPQYCWNSKFLSMFCKQFPFQSMKIVRIRLNLMESILKDDTLNVKMILLVRDPRGILQSRKHRDWCPGVPDCDQPEVLCEDMVSDYEAAMVFKNKYAGKFRIYRYEDIVEDLENHVKAILSFFDLNFHPAVHEFLDSHTKVDAGGVSSTFRDSKNAPYHWKLELKYKEVNWIQKNCKKAMTLWGYINAQNDSHLHSFNPVGNYSI